MSRFSDRDLERDLERVVGEALAAEQEVPAGWREAALGAFSWRSVDQELLELTYDSLLEDVAGAALRGDVEGRTLEFSGGGLTLEIELTNGRVAGRLTGRGELSMEHADGSSVSIATDESGFFSVASESRGPVRFVVRDGDARLVAEWIVP